MKNRKLNLVALSAFVCSLILTSCGGGSGSSGLKKNEYFGSLPSIYADYKASKEANEAKLDKMQEDVKATKDIEKAMKLATELKEKEKAAREKMHTDASAEISKLIGKEVPVSFSKALQSSDELFYNVLTKLEANKDYLLKINLSFTAKNNFDVPARKVGESGKNYWAYYRLIAADGSTIRTGFASDLVVQGYQPSSVTAGAALKENSFTPCDLTYMMHEPAKYANFAGIEFITKSEYDTIPKK